MAKKHRTRRKHQNRASQRNFYAIAVVIILVLVGILGYSYVNQPPQVKEARLRQDVSLGAAAAPVEIVEYGAYGCSACRSVHQNGIVQGILQTYGDSVRFTFRNWPVIHVNDVRAARAAQCALDQGADSFWTYHNALYDLSNSQYNNYSKEAAYVSLAESVGIDDEALGSCLKDRTHNRTVSYWKERADRLNMQGTPTFYVNGQRLNNAGQLDDAVRAALGLS